MTLAFVKTRDVLVVTAWCPVPRLAIAEAPQSELLLKRDRKLSHLIPALKCHCCCVYPLLFTLPISAQHGRFGKIHWLVVRGGWMGTNGNLADFGAMEVLAVVLRL